MTFDAALVPSSDPMDPSAEPSAAEPDSDPDEAEESARVGLSAGVSVCAAAVPKVLRPSEVAKIMADAMREMPL